MAKFNSPVFASDLKTRSTLRVFTTSSGGSLAVDHALNLHKLERFFITGDYKKGFTLTFEGFTETYEKWGEAVEAFSFCIIEILRQGNFRKFITSQ